MTNRPEQQMTINEIMGSALTFAKLDGDYIVIPLNDPYGDEVVRVHISNAHGLGNSLLWLSEIALNEREREHDASADYRRLRATDERRHL